jgi:protein SPT2
MFIFTPNFPPIEPGDSNTMVKIGDLLAQITGEPSPTTSSFPKADDEPRKQLDKAKKPTTQATSPSKPMAVPRKPSPVDPRTKSPANGSRPSSATTFKNGQPTPPPSNDPPKPPKKGSYAEIMARGQAAQKVLGQVGKIQHKKIERLPSRREREQMTAQRAGKIQKGLAPNSKFQKMGQSAISDGPKKSVKAKAEHVPEKKVKKAALATTGYAGTARPKPGSSAYSSRPSPGSSSHPGRYDDRKRSAYTDDNGNEDEDEEPDYASDVSSDMEAAAFEVDEEEEMAARIARREDAQALDEENRLKREKEEKKRRLMAMAKKAKPVSY